jgi:hypothetical protein
MGNPGPTEGVVNSVDDAKQAVRQRYKMVLIGSKLLLQVVFYPLQKAELMLSSLKRKWML